MSTELINPGACSPTTQATGPAQTQARQEIRVRSFAAWGCYALSVIAISAAFALQVGHTELSLGLNKDLVEGPAELKADCRTVIEHSADGSPIPCIAASPGLTLRFVWCRTLPAWIATAQVAFDAHMVDDPQVQQLSDGVVLRPQINGQPAEDVTVVPGANVPVSIEVPSREVSDLRVEITPGPKGDAAADWTLLTVPRVCVSFRRLWALVSLFACLSIWLGVYLHATSGRS